MSDYRNFWRYFDEAYDQRKVQYGLTKNVLPQWLGVVQFHIYSFKKNQILL